MNLTNEDQVIAVTANGIFDNTNALSAQQLAEVFPSLYEFEKETYNRGYADGIQDYDAFRYRVRCLRFSEDHPEATRETVIAEINRQVALEDVHAKAYFAEQHARETIQ